MVSVVGAVCIVLTLLARGAETLPSDYDAELQRIEQQIADVRGGGEVGPDGLPRTTRLAALMYRRASLTADFAQLREAETSIEDALREAPSAELVLLRANFNFKMHRLQRAQTDVASIPELADRSAVRTLSAQIALQEGDYAAAGKAYEAVVKDVRSWDSLAGLAYWRAHTGSAGAADALYLEAEDEITAKEMRSYAWVELQRGVLDFDRRRYHEALAHYRVAERAYSGYWLIEEHIAEALNRLGRTAQAVEMYQRVIERTHNPEFVSALAAIVARSDPARARTLYAQADASYEEQLRLYPEAAAGHLLRHWLARPESPLTRVLALARLNVAARPNAEAKLLLAKSCWKADQPEEARRLVAEVMRTPWRTPEIIAFSDEVRSARTAQR